MGDVARFIKGAVFYIIHNITPMGYVAGPDSIRMGRDVAGGMVL